MTDEMEKKNYIGNDHLKIVVTPTDIINEGVN